MPSNLLTHSRLQSFKTCGRKHYLEYELGIRPKRSSQPLRMGDAFHKGKEFWRKGAPPEEAITQALAGYEAVPEGIDPATWAIEREKILRLLHAYMHYWSNDGLEIIETERSYEMSILNPATGAASRNWRQGGKIDGIVRLPDGRLAVDETKTAGKDISDGSDYWQRLQIDEQISRYVYSARKLGFDIHCVHYDVIRKPTIEPRQIPLLDENGIKIVLDASGQRVLNKDGSPKQSASAEQGWTLQTRTETPDEYGARLTEDIASRPAFYFARRELTRIEKDLEEFELDLWHQQQVMSDMRRTGRWFKNTSACVGFGRCQYADLCFAHWSENDPLPDGFGYFENVHPELDSRDE